MQAVWERLHDQPRLVLKAEYPNRHDSGRIEGRHVVARRMEVSLREYENALAYAVNRVRDAFEVRA